MSDRPPVVVFTAAVSDDPPRLATRCQLCGAVATVTYQLPRPDGSLLSVDYCDGCDDFADQFSVPGEGGES